MRAIADKKSMATKTPRRQLQGLWEGVDLPRKELMAGAAGRRCMAEAEKDVKICLRHQAALIRGSDLPLDVSVCWSSESRVDC